MKIIGAGLPRTATLTQKVALEMLGAGPCYHMVNVLSDLSVVPLWEDALNGQVDWNKIFAGFQSAVDFPSSFYYRELMDAFPEAKVLLSVRDGDAWVRSMHDTIWGVLWGDTLMHDLSMASMRVDSAFASYADLMRAMFARSGLQSTDWTHSGPILTATAMERYNQEIRAYVPQDRLLVWSPADGWEPLCEFVGAPVPSVPLPRTNDTKAFTDRAIGMCLESLNNWYAQHAQPVDPAALTQG